MNREQAINYLRSSGYSEEQIQIISDAFSYNTIYYTPIEAEAYQKAFEDIRAEFIRWIEMDGGSYEYDKALKRGLNIVDKHDPAKMESEGEQDV